MTRLGRLGAPAVVCLLVGLLQLFDWRTGRVELRGGPVTVGLYGAAVQLVLSLLAVAVVDDLRPGATWGARRRRRRVGWRDVATRPVGFARSFPAFYLRFFLPVAALAFGVGVSVTAVVFALLPWEPYEVAGTWFYDTELVLGGLWLLGTVALVAVRAAPRALGGFVVGFGLAAVCGHVLLSGDELRSTLVAWGTVALVLTVLGGAAALARRRRQPVPA